MSQKEIFCQMFGRFPEMHYICDVERPKGHRQTYCKTSKTKSFDLVEFGKFNSTTCHKQFSQARQYPSTRTRTALLYLLTQVFPRKPNKANYGEVKAVPFL